MSIKAEILAAIDEMSLGGKNINIHSSMRSFVPKHDDIAQILTDSFLEKGCTVLAPAFSYEFEAYPTDDLRPVNNGAGDYSYFSQQKYKDMAPFTTDSKKMSTYDIGYFPEYLLHRDESIRGYHPTNSFVSIGKDANEFVKHQTEIDVYAPFRYLLETDGYVLLIGVGLDTATIIHYAENLAGRNLFIRWAKDVNGKTIPTQNGGCSDGFPNLDETVSSIERKIIVGGSTWRIFKARDLVDFCAKKIKNDPMITHCGKINCDRCNDAMLGGPNFFK